VYNLAFSSLRKTARYEGNVKTHGLSVEIIMKTLKKKRKPALSFRSLALGWLSESGSLQ